VEYRKELPPLELIRDCPHPELQVRVNSDLAEGILAYRDSLSKCNIDKQALREWADIKD
jgi:hypothetical protein